MPRDPQGHEIPVEWTVVRVEKHGRKFIHVEYHYLCEHCAISFATKQTSLPLKTIKTLTTPPHDEVEGHKTCDSKATSP